MGRAVLVTGAASGIGKAIAERLRGDGAQVLGVDLAEADVEADLTTRAGNRDAVAAALERFGRLDAVIPNGRAGHARPGLDRPLITPRPRAP